MYKFVLLFANLTDYTVRVQITIELIELRRTDSLTHTHTHTHAYSIFPVQSVILFSFFFFF